MASLQRLKGDRPDKEFPLDRKVTLIGKGSACHIVLADPHVSKTHACIERMPDGLYIQDLNSTNGTMVGGRELVGRHRLKGGEIVEICNYRFTYVDDHFSTDAASTVIAILDASTASNREIAKARPEEKLRAIMEISSELVGTVGLDCILEKVLGAMFRLFPQTERGFVLFKEEGTGALITRASMDRHPESSRQQTSKTIYDQVTSEGQAILSQDIAIDTRFNNAGSVRDSQLCTMMCVPLLNNQRHPVGILQLDTRDEKGRFEQEDLDFLVAVAGPVSMAVENARLHEVEIRQQMMEQEARDAGAVQRALIAEGTPVVAGYEFHDHYEPAQSVGGDYFDYRPMPDLGGVAAPSSPARWAVALGDVAGKGMPAALIMARLSSEVRLLVQAEPDPARVVEALNHNQFGSGSDKFITFLLVVLDGERHELTVVNAGHMGPLIRRANGRIEEIGSDWGGLPLGIVKSQTYRSGTVPIHVGDVVILYTDGVSEAMDPEDRQFGIVRLTRAIALAPPGAAPIREAILSAVRDHVAGRAQHDDITLLCFGRVS
jgi:phosphoserine phosphatase RsbU/P